MKTGNFGTLSRTDDQKLKIQSLWSAPVVIDNFLTEDELSALKAKISKQEHIDSHKGEKQESLLVAKMRGADLPLFFIRKMRRLVQGFRIRGLFAFDSNTPFMLHSDAGLDPNAIPFKNFTFCLEENRFDEQLVLFNAFSYFSVSINDLTKFVYSKDVLDDYKFLIATPDEFLASPNAFILKTSKSSMTVQEKNHLLRHIPLAEHQKFEVVETIKYARNRLIVFDSCQLHSGSSLATVERSAVKRMIIFTDYAG